MLSILAAIGIMSALNQEAALILDQMKDKETVQIGCKEFVQGTFEEVPVVFTLSGIGKVSAATTATLLIAKFDVEGIVFTGVAGGGSGTEIGDVVIGHTYLQHDIDIRPIFPQFYIFSLNQQTLKADEDLLFKMKAAADQFFLQGISFPDLGIYNPKVHEGVIASGDQFVISTSHHHSISENVRTVLPGGFQAIEMEGAAVAQTCHELKVPFVVLRAISDRADHAAPVDFLTFTDQVASFYSFGILKEFFKGWKVANLKIEPIIASE
jgi:adenosylhomocysteine nucleosidase